MSQVEINHNAVRVLYAGLNGRREYRRVLYLPYMDGYVSIIETDADGNFIAELPVNILTQHTLPEKYWDSIPEDIRPQRYDGDR